MERIDFLISPNPGNPSNHWLKLPRGELSRIMLALKVLLAKADEIPVLVFDEVDTASAAGHCMRLQKNCPGWENTARLSA